MALPDYAPHRKTVIIHEDDVGMTHGANVAFAKLSESGKCTCGAVMVPCPWFPEAVDLMHRNPDFDLGVHLTLNSEKAGYRWRPLTRPGAAAGLTDPDGYFWPTVPELRRNAHPEAVDAELRAQIDTALSAGIDVTHLDCHMGAAMMPEFVEGYYRLSIDHDLPVQLVKDLSQFNPLSYAGPLSTDAYDAVVARARADGHPVYERIIESPWDRTGDAEAAYRQMIEEIPDGLTYLSLHFNDVGDFEVIEPDKAYIRTEEYAFFDSGQFQEWASELGIAFVGMRGLRDKLRAHRRSTGCANRSK
ncbi:MAG: polysaccharide deacetylase family protein [Rhodospirillales bacterium]|nr:polysaccharide deacetylase family protein [Rhodospirillales bacterium]